MRGLSLGCQRVARTLHGLTRPRNSRAARRASPMRHSTRAGGDAPGAADGRGSANSADGGSPGGDQQAAAGAAPLQDGDPRFRVLSEQVLHRRYLTLYNRSVQFPEGPVLEYDVVGHPQADFKFAVVFPYHSADGGSVTLIREYAQGPHQLVCSLPTGGFDPRRHTSLEACARAELSEEARLAGGSWEPLLPVGHPGIAEVKWCRNRFLPYLAVDPHPDAAPGSRDAEEHTIEVVRVGLPELRRLMLSGDMLLPSVATCYLALERLEARQQRHEGGSGMQQQQQQQQQQQRQQQQQPEGGQG